MMTNIDEMAVRTMKPRRWMFNADMYLTPPVKTLSDVRDDQRLRQMLKRAVNRDRAPQWLVDSIRSGIRG
jgi:hypothetical protein